MFLSFIPEHIAPNIHVIFQIQVIYVGADSSKISPVLFMWSLLPLGCLGKWRVGCYFSDSEERLLSAPNLHIFVLGALESVNNGIKCIKEIHLYIS